MITSRGNDAVKRIRALRTRKERDAAALCFIEGIRLVGEAAESGAPVETCVVAPDLLSSPFALRTVDTLRAAGVPVLEVSGSVFESISSKDGPQGIGAVVRQRWDRLDAIDPALGLCWTALNAVADPGNLGTILRTSDAAGGAGVILLGPATDPYDPTALRAGMGAVFAQRLVRTTFDALRAWATEHGVMLVGATDAATVSYRDAAYTRPTVLLMGSEREGLTARQTAACDATVRIPMHGTSDSLNLAVATAILLYELEGRFTAEDVPASDV